MALALPWADNERKRSNLLRIKLVATGLLPVMAALFVFSAHYKAQIPALAWLEAFSEAALVGGLADWFAVVALFRRPGGLPLPHTAIIPNNKERIGRQLGTFVELNFLTPENITAKLRDFDIAGRVVGWFANPENARRLVDAARVELPRFISAVDEPEIERAIARVITDEIERLDLAPIIARLLTMLAREGKHQRFLDDMLPIVARWLSQNRAEIKMRFGRRSVLTPPWVDSYIVERFVDGIIDLFGEIGRTPDHEMRLAFDKYVRHLITSLKRDQDLMRKVGDIRTEILRSRVSDTAVSAAWRTIKARLETASWATECESDGLIARMVAQVANEMLSDRPLVDRLNANVLAAIESALRHSQNQFAALIEDIVRKWDTQLVTEKVELELGPDLQFIRLNGTFIGGLAGVALHAGLVVTAVNG